VGVVGRSTGLADSVPCYLVSEPTIDPSGWIWSLSLVRTPFFSGQRSPQQRGAGTGEHVGFGDPGQRFAAGEQSPLEAVSNHPLEVWFVELWREVYDPTQRGGAGDAFDGGDVRVRDVVIVDDLFAFHSGIL
jgi:hypothetical protein